MHTPANAASKPQVKPQPHKPDERSANIAAMLPKNAMPFICGNLSSANHIAKQQPTAGDAIYMG